MPFNESGAGSARFSPLTSPDGSPIGHLYLGSTAVAALLETAFHEVGPGRTNQIDEGADLAGWHLRSVEVTRVLRLADLRDGALDGLAIRREQLVATSQAHYPCTREWAERMRSSGRRVDGLIWQSRLVEVASERSPLMKAIEDTNYADSLIVYDDRVDPSDLVIAADDEDLASPRRRALVDQIADALDVPIL